MNPIAQTFLDYLYRNVYRRWIRPAEPFDTSRVYWQDRYAKGGNSGAGAFDRTAIFKANLLNTFVQEQQIQTVIEHGCGDGNQLRLAHYPAYIGFDISDTALTLCRQRFAKDPSKHFLHTDTYTNEQAELALSLDVIYHLIEDAVFEAYMIRLFGSATRFVIIYSSNTNLQAPHQEPHVKHRHCTAWVELHQPAWQLIHHIPNEFPVSLYPHEGSFADFFVYARR